MIRWIEFERPMVVHGSGQAMAFFDARDGWVIGVNDAIGLVTLERGGNELQNIRAVPRFKLRGYAYIYEERSDAPEARQEQGNDSEEHQDGNQGGPTTRPSRRNRIQQGAQGKAG